MSSDLGSSTEICACFDLFPIKDAARYLEIMGNNVPQRRQQLMDNAQAVVDDSCERSIFHIRSEKSEWLKKECITGPV